MAAFADSVGLLFRIQADSSQGKKELNNFSKDVKKEAGEVASSGSSSFNKFTQSLGLSTEQAAKLSTALPVVGAAIAGITTVAVQAGIALFNLAKEASDYGSEIKDASDKTGLSSETLSVMRLAAEQSGTSMEQLSTAANRFSKTVAEAAEGSKNATEKLVRLGIDPQKAIKDLDGALSDVFKRIIALPPGVTQTKAAMDAFGKSGAELLPFIKQFDGDLPKLIEKARELGLVLSTEDVNAADDFGDALAELQAQAKGTTFTFAREFLPVFTDGMKSVGLLVSQNKGIISEWGKITADVFKGLAVGVKLLQSAFDASLLGIASRFLDTAAKARILLALISPLGAVAETLGGRFGNRDAGLGGEIAEKPATDYLGSGGGDGGKKAEAERQKRLDSELRNLDEKEKSAKALYDSNQKYYDELLKADKIGLDKYKAESEKNLNEFISSMSGQFAKVQGVLDQRYKGTELDTETTKNESAKAKFLTDIGIASLKINTDVSEKLIKIKEDEYKEVLRQAEEAAESEQKTLEESLAKKEITEVAYLLRIGKSKSDFLIKERTQYAKLASDIATILRENSGGEVLTDDQLLRNESYLKAREESSKASSELNRQNTENNIKLVEYKAKIEKELNEELQDSNEKLTERGIENRRKELTNLIESGVEVKKNRASLRDFELSVAQEELTRQQEVIEKKRQERMKDVQGLKDQIDLEDEITSNSYNADLLAVEEYEAKKKEIQDKYKDKSLSPTQSLLGGLLGQGEADVFIGIGNMITQTLGTMAQAAGNAVAAFVKFGSAGGSLRKFAAEMIASIAQMAAVQAVWNLAEGFAKLALAYFGHPTAGASATQHFIAAGMYGAIAGVAAIAGRAVAGDSFKSQAGGATGSAGGAGRAGTSTSSDDRTSTEARLNGQRVATKVIEMRIPRGSVAQDVLDDFNNMGVMRDAVIKLVEG